MKDINTFLDKHDDSYLKKCLSRFEDRHKLRIIFGSVIGSCSQGLNNPSSDLDVRFLFLDSEFKFSEAKDRHDEEKKLDFGFTITQRSVIVYLFGRYPHF